MKKLLLISILLFSACRHGPTIAVARMAYFPSRGDQCQIKFIQTTPIEQSGQGPYHLVGSISLGEYGNNDPLSERYISIIRPKACAMGGDLITIAASAVTHGQTYLGTNRPSTSIVYVVLRYKKTIEQPDTKRKDI